MPFIHLRLPLGRILVLAFVAVGSITQNAAGQQWPEERQTGVFHCHANFRLDQHASMLSQLGRLQTDVCSTLHLTPTEEPIHLFLFDSSRTYRGYMQKHFPRIPYRRALFIKGRGPGMVFAFRDSAFEVDVRHESTHAVLHSILPMVPLWLDEGLAEYFEVEQKNRARQNPHQSSTKWNVRFGRVTSISQLESLESLEQMGSVEYRHAWAWVHFMLHGPSEANEELLLYLADVESHTASRSLGERLKRRIPNLEERLAQHFKQW